MRSMWAVMLLGAVAIVAVPALAQEDSDRHGGAFRIGSDVFRAGSQAVHDAPDADDVFLAGERVRLGAEITGSAHLAGRRVEIAGAVARDVYAAGYDVELSAPVAGDATLAGYDVRVGAAVGESLRAAGASVEVTAPVGGPSILAADDLRLDAAFAGDVAVMAETMTFGPGASIGGRLLLYGDEQSLAEVPASVVPPERIELREVDDWDRGPMDMRPPTVAMATGGFIVGVLILALLAWLAAVIAPVGIEVLRDRVSARPFRTLGIGFLTLSALIGAAVVLALTIVGILVAPLLILAAVLIGLAGYVVTVYILGSTVWEAIGRGEPDTLGERAIAGLIGALLASVIVLVPFLGWLFMLAAVLLGMGALAWWTLGKRV